MGQPLTGATFNAALGPELALGAPNHDWLTAYDTDPTGTDGDIDYTESESGQVNRSGIKVDALPGPAEGKAEFTHPLTPAHLIEFFAHLQGNGSVAEIEAASGEADAVQQYTFEYSALREMAQSFYMFVGNDPVERYWLQGLKWNKASFEIGDNTEIATKLEGIALHKSALGPPTPDGGNVGTYAYAPVIRGPLVDPSAGPVHVQVAAVAPLTFKVEQGAAPAWTGSAQSQTYDEEGSARWVHVVGDDGADLGRVAGSNKDPLLMMFPGTATDHADLAVGDTWTWAAPNTWNSPTPSYIVGSPRLTSAHWGLQLRPEGSADPYLDFDATGGSFEMEIPLAVDRGRGSRYGYDLVVDGDVVVRWKLKRSFTSRFFRERKESGARLDCRMALEAYQIGASFAHREAISYALPAVKVTEHTVKKNKGRAEEEITLEMRPPENPALNPLTITSTTTRQVVLPAWI